MCLEGMYVDQPFLFIIVFVTTANLDSLFNVVFVSLKKRPPWCCIKNTTSTKTYARTIRRSDTEYNKENMLYCYIFLANVSWKLSFTVFYRQPIITQLVDISVQIYIMSRTLPSIILQLFLRSFYI